MPVRLTENARPQLTVTPRVFRKHAEDGEYAGVPLEYFSVESNYVYLSASIAREIEWSIDERGPDVVNINALTQTVVVDGQELSLQPGVFCSYVHEDEIVGLTDSDTV